MQMKFRFAAVPFDASSVKESFFLLLSLPLPYDKIDSRCFSFSLSPLLCAQNKCNEREGETGKQKTGWWIAAVCTRFFLIG